MIKNMDIKFKKMDWTSKEVTINVRKQRNGLCISKNDRYLQEKIDWYMSNGLSPRFEIKK